MLKGLASDESSSVNESKKFLSFKPPCILQVVDHKPRAAPSEENIGRKDTFKSILSLINSAK